jgi:hypothetical protein
MRVTLRPHIDYPGPAIAIEVEAGRSGDRLSLAYRLSGDVAAVRWPAPAPPGRADELWRHTCFEAFVAPLHSQGYCEVNFSPSGQWATYCFAGYRTGMELASAEPAPFSPRVMAKTELLLPTEVDLGRLVGLAGSPWRLGLTAVIEAADGRVSYWSMAHPTGKPDFHHPDCLALELAAPDGP